MADQQQPHRPRWYARSQDEIGREFGVDPAVGSPRKKRAPSCVERPQRIARSAAASLADFGRTIYEPHRLGAGRGCGGLRPLGRVGRCRCHFAIVLLNGLLGFLQEYRAEQSLAALRTLAVTYARVVRGGTRLNLSSTELVPGDIVDVEAGDHVPADARLLQAASLRTQEAALTGESTPVEKLSAALPDSDLPLRINETCSSWGPPSRVERAGGCRGDRQRHRVGAHCDLDDCGAGRAHSAATSAGAVRPCVVGALAGESCWWCSGWECGEASRCSTCF